MVINRFVADRFHFPRSLSFDGSWVQFFVQSPQQSSRILWKFLICVPNSNFKMQQLSSQSAGGWGTGAKNFSICISKALAEWSFGLLKLVLLCIDFENSSIYFASAPAAVWMVSHFCFFLYHDGNALFKHSSTVKMDQGIEENLFSISRNKVYSTRDIFL